MSLTQANLTLNAQWTLSKATSGFGTITEGPDSQTFSLSPLTVTSGGFNQSYNAFFALNSGATQAVDLTSVTNLIGESVAFTKALTVMVSTSGSQFSIGPGTSNPLQWFFGGTSGTVKVNAGGCFAWSDPPTSSGTLVNGSNKSLLITNTGSASGSVSMTVFGGTN